MDSVLKKKRMPKQSETEWKELCYKVFQKCEELHECKIGKKISVDWYLEIGGEDKMQEREELPYNNIFTKKDNCKECSRRKQDLLRLKVAAKI